MWSDKDLEKKLDRVLVDQSWQELNISLSVLHLNRMCLDHSLLFLTYSASSDSCPQSFRFLDVWRMYSQFQEVVCRTWDFHCDGRPIEFYYLSFNRLSESFVRRVGRYLIMWGRRNLWCSYENVNWRIILLCNLRLSWVVPKQKWSWYYIGWLVFWVKNQCLDGWKKWILILNFFSL